MISVTRLKLIFGKEASGVTPEDFARTSQNTYVRSQVQIALASSQAKGRILTAPEALRDYGLDVLEKVANNGAATLVTGRDEPSKTLKESREQLQLDVLDLSRATGLSTDTIAKIETPGQPSKIRDIERVAYALALDERTVGLKRHETSDHGLGVRLRQLRNESDSTRFDARSVLKLAEAGWVISRQNELARLLQIPRHEVVSKRTLSNSDYGYKTADKGYALAKKAREALGYKIDEPINSVRDLVERRLGVPLIQDQLNHRFAGATIANGDDRGIVVNEAGQNQTSWVRRMTLAHEIGHLLCDPDQRLNRLRVDLYDGISTKFENEKDEVERRANAFAIAFLAPPEGVRVLAAKASTLESMLATVTQKYGISKTAAMYHIQNVTGLNTSGVRLKEVPNASEDWDAQENLTIDYFPISQAPISRRGRFALLVVKAQRSGHISCDTAAAWLKSDVQEYVKAADIIVNLQD